jgi:hypothetical protein
MLYDEMKAKYPNKEIKLVPAEYEKQYISFGFKTIETCNQPAFGKNYNYCFMIEE